MTNEDLTLTLNNRIFYEQPDKLRRTIAIYDSNMSDFDKIKEIKKIFTQKDEFDKLVRTFSSKILDYPGYKEISDKLVEISLFYMQSIENGMMEIAKEHNKNEKYFAILKESVEAIERYIQYDESFSIVDFCNKYGYTIKDFEMYVETISKLDKTLYDKYLEKSKSNKLFRIEETRNKCLRINEGIETGEVDGHEFTQIDFFKMLPFYEYDRRKEIVNDLNIRNNGFNLCCLRNVFSVLGADKKLFIQYTNKENISESSFDKVKEKEFLKDGLIVNGILLDDEDKNNIISYMKDENIPMIKGALYAVRQAYMNETLHTKEKGKEKVLKSSH